MLNGRPVVFPSCSDRYKESVAAKVRAALDDVDVWGVIVSDEPLLPHVELEPGAKVESYMNASDAVVALCTPDDPVTRGAWSDHAPICVSSGEPSDAFRLAPGLTARAYRALEVPCGAIAPDRIKCIERNQHRDAS